MKKILFALLAVAAINLTSCKKEKTNTNNSGASISGTWNLNLWDGAPASGTMIFTANTLDFTCSTYSFDEKDSYTVNGSKYTFTKTGGASSVISGGNDWTMDSLTDHVLRMTSNFGLIVRATR